MVLGIYSYDIYLLLSYLKFKKEKEIKKFKSLSRIKKPTEIRKKITPITEKRHYKKMNPRNIFLPPDFKLTKKQKKKFEDMGVIYELTGVIPDKRRPIAILINTKTKNTILATTGQTLDDGETKLMEIGNNFVILEKRKKKKRLPIKP